MPVEPELLRPQWPAPANVRAFVTTRRIVGKDVTSGGYGNFNLGFHVGDKADQVRRNWQALATAAQLPEIPPLVSQVHGTVVTHRGDVGPGLEADGVYSNRPGSCCAILTADCLPILLCDQAGTEVAALHAGWRGLAAGIVAKGVAYFAAAPGQLLAYLGPAISQQHFEVGAEVRDAFLKNRAAWGTGVAGCFRQTSFCQTVLGKASFGKTSPVRWHANLYQLARLALGAAGVTAIHGGGYCTYADSGRFYSHRRDGVSGRMASMIWFD